MAQFKQDLESNPNLYQYERVERLGVSKSAIWYTLKRLQNTQRQTNPKGNTTSV